MTTGRSSTRPGMRAARDMFRHTDWPSGRQTLNFQCCTHMRLFKTNAAISMSTPMNKLNSIESPTKKPCGFEASTDVAHIATTSTAIALDLLTAEWPNHSSRCEWFVCDTSRSHGSHPSFAPSTESTARSATAVRSKAAERQSSALAAQESRASLVARSRSSESKGTVISASTVPSKWFSDTAVLAKGHSCCSAESIASGVPSPLVRTRTTVRPLLSRRTLESRLEESCC